KYNLEAVDYDDEDPVVLDNLAQTYYKMGLIEEAKEYFEKAEEQKDNQAVTLYHLGIIYAGEGHVELAKEKLNKALTCNLTPLSAVTYEDIEERLRELD
ncbi:MAG TPA: tetratricopeptide repeat protein, partial [Clostridia bacterium]|nr:tetratricopeptide repeat protein [Clostridia bacterium]